MTFTAQMRLTIFLSFLATVFTVGIVSYAVGSSNTRADQPVYNVVVEEDGSGVQYIGDTEVATFPEGTFFWDCRVMGNRSCGPVEEGEAE